MQHIFQTTGSGLLLSNQEFNATIGEIALAALRRRRYSCVTTIPATGKIFIIGDLHEQVDILLDIFNHIQANPETSLELNPNNKIILLGDLITPTKSFLSSNTVLGLDQADPDHLRGDIMVRAITMLIALYPDQIIPINGNHELGFYLGVLLEREPNLNYHPLLLQDILSSHHIGSASISNYKFYAQVIETLPMMVFIQKPKERYVIMHSPGAHPLPTEQQLLQTKYILDWTTPKTEAYLNVTKGHGNINQLQEYAQALNASKLFFGHAAPDGLIMAAAEQRWIKTDNNPGVLGFNGAGCFVDSQTRTIHSGYISLDFDNNQEAVITMPSIISKHPESQLALQATQIQKPQDWSTKWQKVIKSLY